MSGAIPAIEPQERAGSSTENRLVGVVAKLINHENGNGGFGFINRYKSTRANDDDFNVYFSSKNCQYNENCLNFDSFEEGYVVEFTLVNKEGRATAKQVRWTGKTIPWPPPKQNSYGAELGEARRSQPLEPLRAQAHPRSAYSQQAQAPRPAYGAPRQPRPAFGAPPAAQATPRGYQPAAAWGHAQSAASAAPRQQFGTPTPRSYPPPPARLPAARPLAAPAATRGLASPATAPAVQSSGAHATTVVAAAFAQPETLPDKAQFFCNGIIKDFAYFPNFPSGFQRAITDLAKLAKNEAWNNEYGRYGRLDNLVQYTFKYVATTQPDLIKPSVDEAKTWVVYDTGLSSSYEMSREPIYALFQKNNRDGVQPYCFKGWCVGWGRVGTMTNGENTMYGSEAPKRFSREVSENSQPSCWKDFDPNLPITADVPHILKDRKERLREIIARWAAAPPEKKCWLFLKVSDEVCIPDVEEQERVAGFDGEEDRLVGVVDWLKTFDDKTGYGKLRRHESMKADAREFQVYFRSCDCKDFDKLKQGSKVEFTLIDNHGRANARNVVPTRTVIELPQQKKCFEDDKALERAVCALFEAESVEFKGLRHVVTCREKLAYAEFASPAAAATALERCRGKTIGNFICNIVVCQEPPPDREIAMTLKAAIPNAVQDARDNRRCVLPQLFLPGGIKSNKGFVRQLLLPLHLCENSVADAALTIELKPDPDTNSWMYKAATVLTIDMAFQNARLVDTIDIHWLFLSLQRNNVIDIATLVAQLEQKLIAKVQVTEGDLLALSAPDNAPETDPPGTVEPADSAV